MFACRKDGQQLATMPWINAWYFYSHRRVDESIGVGSKLPGLQPQHKDLVCLVLAASQKSWQLVCF